MRCRQAHVHGFCDGNDGPSASVPVPDGNDFTTITTTDTITPDSSTTISDCVVITFSTVVPFNTDSVPGPVPPARVVRRAGSAHLSFLPSPSAPFLLLRRPPVIWAVYLMTTTASAPTLRQSSLPLSWTFQALAKPA